MLVEEEGDKGADGGRRPVDLQLEWVLGKMPQKLFKLERLTPNLQPLSLPAGLTVRAALERVLRLPAVASKRYLTNKVRLHPHVRLSFLVPVNDYFRLCSSLSRWTDPSPG